MLWHNISNYFCIFFTRDSCMYAFQVNKKNTRSSTAHSLVPRERNHYFLLPPTTLLIIGWRTKVHQYKMWFKTVLLKDQHLNKSECRQTPGYTINKIELDAFEYKKIPWTCLNQSIFHVNAHLKRVETQLVN